MSTTGQGLQRPSGEDAFIHGMSSLVLPKGNDLDSMDTKAQHKYFKKVTKQCEKVINLLDTCLSAFERKEGALSVEEQITADMAKLKKLSIANQCKEMMLWRRVRLFNEARLEEVRRLGYGRGVVDRSAGDGMIYQPNRDTDPAFLSYKEAYLSDVVNRYQADLEKIREKEGLDAEQTKFLLNCLEASADLFANVQLSDQREEG